MSDSSGGAVAETAESRRTIRWGIAGPGTISRRFGSQLLTSEVGVLAGVASRSLERAQAFADEFGPQDAAAGVAVYGSYDELFEDPAIDAVYIGTVHTEHVRLAMRALEAGKHVVCEKPMAVDHAGVMRLVEAARDAGVYLAEGFMYRFHPQIARFAELLESGAIGTIQHVDASFAFATDAASDHRLANPELAGGGILDVGGYPVSVARLVAGIAEGRSFASGTAFAEPVSLTAVGTLSPEGVDEWATASLVFPSGVTANVRSGIRLQDDNEVTVIGSAGRITLRDPWLPSETEGSDIDLDVVGRPRETIHIAGDRQWGLEGDAVASNHAAGQSPEITWADSLGNAATLDRWRDAIGLRYPFEADTAFVPTADGRPLRVRDGSTMRYGTIAGIDKPVSRLVLGCDNQRTLGHATAMFDHFTELGGNTFDTGYVYGNGLMERLLGQWITNRGIRDDIVVIGKGAHTPHCDPESITRQLGETLDRLQTDHLDLYLMHRDNPAIPVGEFVDVLDEHARAGRIRAFGGSNWTISRYQEALDYAAANGKQGFAALSDHFGLARALDVPWAGCEHVTEPADREWLERTGTALLPWSSQARGFFARADPADLSDAELVRCYYSDDNFERLARARSLADELGVQPTAVALAYVLAQSFPTFALFGPRSLEETRTSMAGLAIDLTPEQVAWLDLRGDR
ncbi:aldo/keto reductase [Frondihabitans peucedani]|uniref:Aldo/keto reductase n=1 Tax=Frondihabitans peucedani TaxID=598626 RepID=A0ABP8DY37_9MICO